MKNFAKILMLLLVVALTCGLVVAMSITSSADAEPIEVDSWQDIIDAFAANASPVNVKLTADIKVEGNQPIARGDKNMVIDLNGHTIEATGANGTAVADWGVLFGAYNNKTIYTITGTGAIKLDNTRLFQGHFELTSEHLVGKFGFNVIGTDPKNPIKITATNTTGSLVNIKDGDFTFKNVSVDFANGTNSVAMFHIEPTLKHKTSVNLDGASFRIGEFGETFTPASENCTMIEVNPLGVANWTNANFAPADIEFNAVNTELKGGRVFFQIKDHEAYTDISGKEDRVVQTSDDKYLVQIAKIGKTDFNFTGCDIEYGKGSAESRIYLSDNSSVLFKNCKVVGHEQDLFNVFSAVNSQYKIVLDGGEFILNTNAGLGNSLISSYSSAEWNHTVTYDGTYGFLITAGTKISNSYSYQGSEYKVVEPKTWGNVSYGKDPATGYDCAAVSLGGFSYEIGVNIVHVSTAADFKTAITASGSNIVMLDADIEIAESCQIVGTPILFMNGKTITMTGAADALFASASNGGLQVYGPGHFNVPRRLSQPYQANTFFRINDDAHNTAEYKITAKKVNVIDDDKNYQFFYMGAGELSVTNFEVDGNEQMSSHLIGSYGQGVGDKTIRINLKNVKLVKGGVNGYAIDLSSKFNSDKFIVNIEDCYFETRFMSAQNTLSGEAGATVDVKNTEWVFRNDSVSGSFNHDKGQCKITFHEGVKISSPNAAGWARTVIGYNKTDDYITCADGIGIFLIGEGVYETKVLEDADPAVVLKGYGNYSIGRDVYLTEEDMKYFFTWAGTCTMMGHPTFTVLKDCSYTAEKAGTWGNTTFNVDLNGHEFAVGCVSGVYYIVLLQKTGDIMNITDSVGGGKLYVKNQQFVQVQTVGVKIDGSADKLVNVVQDSGYFIDFYNGSTSEINYLNYKHTGSGYAFSINLTARDDIITVKNSVIAGENLPRIFHMEETREGEARFVWTGKLDVTIEDTTINCPKATLINHKVANAPVTVTVKDSDLTVKNLATYEELGVYGKDTGSAKAGDAKNPGKFSFTMTGGSYTQKNVLFQNATGSFVEEKDLYADVLFTGVKVTCDESMFLNNNEFDCTEPLTFKDCEIRHNGGGRFNNSHCKGNRFVVIDGGTFSAAGTDALCWKTLVKAGTVFDKLDYLKNNDNGMAVANEGVAIIKDAAGYKVVAIDELPEDAQFVIYRANTQPNKHYTLACFDTLDAALAEVKGGDVLTVNPSKKGFETSYTWNVPAGNITVNLCGNFIEAYSDFIVVNNATTLTFNNGCFIADAKLLTVNNDSAVINFVGEDAEENPFVLSTAFDTGMIEIVAGSVNFTNTSVEAIKVVGEGDDMEEVAIEDKNLVLLGEGYSATDSTYNGEKLEWIVYHMFSVTNGNVVTYGKTLDEFEALLKTSPAADIVITLLDDVRFVKTVEVKIDPVATGSYTLDLNGHNLCLDGYKLSLYSNYPLTIKNSADTLSKITGKWTDANHTASGKTDRDGDTMFAVSRASSKLFIEGANIQAFGSQLADVDNGATFVANGLYYNMCVYKTDGIFKLGNGGKPSKMECNDCTFVIENSYGPVLVKAVHGELVFNNCSIYAADQTKGMFLDSYSESAQYGSDTPVIKFNGCQIFGNLAQFSADKGLKAVLDENCIVTAYDPAIVLVPEGYELVAADKTESVKVIDVTFDFETYPTTETPTEAVAHYAVAKKASVPALKANLTLYSNIAYNIYVSAQDYARITAAKYVIGEIEYPLAFVAMNDEYYVASIDFGAAFIADKFNVEITADEETYVWEDLSVLAYASAMMETVDDAEKTAIASMVAYAKVVAGLLGEVPADLVAFDTELAKKDAVEIVAGETAEGITATYALGTEAGLRLHATEGTYTIKFNGQEISHNFAEDNDLVIIIRAYHMGDDVVVSLGADEYCYNIANFAEGDLATAAANYAAAAAALAD